MVDWVEAIFTDAQLKAAIQLIGDRYELSSPPVVSWSTMTTSKSQPRILGVAPWRNQLQEQYELRPPAVAAWDTPGGPLVQTEFP